MAFITTIIYYRIYLCIFVFDNTPLLLKEWFLFCFWISDCLVIEVPNLFFFLHLVFSKRVLIQSHFKHTELDAFGTGVRPDALLYAHKVRTKPLKKNC